ncbi:MAG: 4-fold beta flower protein [Vulcanimicrobiaceae bacterium]
MDIIYGYSGDAIGFVQRGGHTANAYSKRGEFLGWSDGENVYAHDGTLLARGQDALDMLFQSSDD